jgi:hypothetical protein
MNDYRDSDFLSKITSMGTLGYPLEKIINVLDISDGDGFRIIFDDPTTHVAKAYRKGQDKAEFLVDIKLMELIKGGDLDAMKLFEERRNELKAIEEKQKEKRKWEQTTS